MNQVEEPNTVTMHNVSNIDIACMIAGEGQLLAAGLLAQAMREGRKYIREDSNPLADLLKAMRE